MCYLANDKGLLGTQSGAGFLGAVVLGLAIATLSFGFAKVRLGKALQPLLGSMLIPFVTFTGVRRTDFTTSSAGDVRHYGRSAALPEHHSSIHENGRGLPRWCDAGV